MSTSVTQEKGGKNPQYVLDTSFKLWTVNSRSYVNHTTWAVPRFCSSVNRDKKRDRSWWRIKPKREKKKIYNLSYEYNISDTLKATK